MHASLTNDQIIAQFKAGMSEYDTFVLSNVTVSNLNFHEVIFRNCVFVNCIFDNCAFDTVTWQNCIFSNTQWVLCSYKDELFAFGGNIFSVDSLAAYSRLLNDRLIESHTVLLPEAVQEPMAEEERYDDDEDMPF